MPRKDRLVFRAVVPRSAKRADRVIAVSERTREDLEELYGIPAEAVKVIPHGIDPIFTPDEAAHDAGYLLVVGSVQRRKDPRAAVDAGNELGMPVVVVGPEREPALARELRALGADVRGYVDHEELPSLYREASALVVPSRYEGFGLPVLEAMASGTPVVAAPDPALVEVAGDAAVFADQGDLSGAILHALDRRAELRAAGLARAAQVQLGRGGAAHGGGLPEPAVSISGVVVVHEPVPELERCLSALKPQVDELVVVSNLGLELPVPEGARLIRNEEPVSFAANANRGIAETSGEFVVVCNPDTEADPGALAVLLAFAEFHPRMGIAGPELRKPDGTLNPSRRRFPTVSGTIVRRTPLRRWLGGTQRAHYGLDEQPTRAGAGRLAARRLPVPAPRDAGRARRVRRGLSASTARTSTSPTAPSKAGWERWYVPNAKAVHAHAAVTDRRLLTRRTLWHWRGIAPLRAQAPRAPEGPLSTIARVQRLETRLKGPILLAPTVHGDKRGFFLETYRQDRLREAGISEEFVQHNHSLSRQGIVRGMHFQPGQAKLVRCARGSVLDVVVDLRRGSPTFGEWEAVQLDDEREPPAVRAGRVRPRVLRPERRRRPRRTWSRPTTTPQRKRASGTTIRRSGSSGRTSSSLPPSGTRTPRGSASWSTTCRSRTALDRLRPVPRPVHG